MARLFCNAVLALVFVLFCFRGGSGALEKPGGCRQSEIPLIRNLSEQGYDSYSLSFGLSHKTVAGAVHHGMKEIEVWIQTIAPHGRSPIHRHACEEVVIILKGYGTFYLSDGHDPDVPGKPKEIPIYPNSTFSVPVNSVHQVWNTHEAEDLQFMVAISRPPMELLRSSNH
ncbi:hypothetical protein M758_9G185500 [Ceratodon purpureus]|nr:hypothetical protein M758_9G185500 [Ceratodon purpureus]